MSEISSEVVIAKCVFDLSKTLNEQSNRKHTDTKTESRHAVHEVSKHLYHPRNCYKESILEETPADGQGNAIDYSEDGLQRSLQKHVNCYLKPSQTPPTT